MNNWRESTLFCSCWLSVWGEGALLYVPRVKTCVLAGLRFRFRQPRCALPREDDARCCVCVSPMGDAAACAQLDHVLQASALTSLGRVSATQWRADPTSTQELPVDSVALSSKEGKAIFREALEAGSMENFFPLAGTARGRVAGIPHALTCDAQQNSSVHNPNQRIAGWGR